MVKHASANTLTALTCVWLDVVFRLVLCALVLAVLILYLPLLCQVLFQVPSCEIQI